MSVILTFCKTCGSLQPEGAGTHAKPTCNNCENSIFDREDRIEGEFSEEEAKNMKKAWCYE